MDWMNRGNRPGQAQQPTAPAPTMGGAPMPQGKKTINDVKGLRIATVALLFSGTILVVLLLIFLAIGGKGPGSEQNFVKKDKLQAVFLNGGQVYFGKVTSLNSNYMRLANIYYLRVNQQVQPNQSQAAQNDISLVKLGCELHGPEDSMVINREQIVFWENLKDDGQVAEAVANYVQQNPNGQDCEADQTSGAGGTAPAGSDAGSDTPGTPGTPAPTEGTNNGQ